MGSPLEKLDDNSTALVTRRVTQRVTHVPACSLEELRPGRTRQHQGLGILCGCPQTQSAAFGLTHDRRSLPALPGIPAGWQITGITLPDPQHKLQHDTEGVKPAPWRGRGHWHTGHLGGHQPHLFCPKWVCQTRGITSGNINFKH